MGHGQIPTVWEIKGSESAISTAHKDVAHLLQNFENVPERVICVDFYQFTRSTAEFYSWIV